MRSFHSVVGAMKKIKQDTMIKSKEYLWIVWSAKKVTFDLRTEWQWELRRRGVFSKETSTERDPDVQKYIKNSFRSRINLSFGGMTKENMF